MQPQARDEEPEMVLEISYPGEVQETPQAGEVTRREPLATLAAVWPQIARRPKEAA